MSCCSRPLQFGGRRPASFQTDEAAHLVGRIDDEDERVVERVVLHLAGLDVFVHEPHVPEALRCLPNVVLTPHIASATIETRSAMARVVVDNVLALARGEPLVTPVA